VSLVLFIIISYSFSFIVTQQKVFEEFRTFLNNLYNRYPYYPFKKVCQLFNCITCMGFWAGVIICLMGFNLFGISKWDFFFSGLLSSVCCYFLDLGRMLIDKYLVDKWSIEL